MLEDGNIHRPARRRVLPPDRNYTQREPFMYGCPLSDYVPRKRPTIHRERPLQECLVSNLIHHKRPPLPRERPTSRSMVSDFLHKKREQRRTEEYQQPQSFFGSKTLLNRRCKSANATHPERATRGGFSMIQALIEEVLPQKPTKVPDKKKPQKPQKRHEEDTRLKSPPVASWPARPASAPFKLSPQNMSPDRLAETLAEKKRNFLLKRPATAPATRPVFHLPLSRINNPRRGCTPKPDCPNLNRAQTANAPVKTQKKDKSETSSSSRPSSPISSGTLITTTVTSSGTMISTMVTTPITSVKSSVKNKESLPESERSSSDDSESDNDSSEESSSTTSSSQSELSSLSTLRPESIEEWLRK